MFSAKNPALAANKPIQRPMRHLIARIRANGQTKKLQVISRTYQVHENVTNHTHGDLVVFPGCFHIFQESNTISHIRKTISLFHEMFVNFVLQAIIQGLLNKRTGSVRPVASDLGLGLRVDEVLMTIKTAFLKNVSFADVSFG